MKIPTTYFIFAVSAQAFKPLKRTSVHPAICNEKYFYMHFHAARGHKNTHIIELIIDLAVARLQVV